MLLTSPVSKMFWQLHYRIFLCIFNISCLNFNRLRRIQSRNIVFSLDVFVHLMSTFMLFFMYICSHLFYFFMYIFYGVCRPFFILFCSLIDFLRNSCFTFAFLPEFHFLLVSLLFNNLTAFFEKSSHFHD